MTIDTKHLRELLAKATTRPWGTDCSRVSHFDEFGELHVCMMHGGPRHDENRDLIVAAVNALPALLDEVDRLRDLEEYHSPNPSMLASETGALKNMQWFERAKTTAAERDAAIARAEKAERELLDVLAKCDPHDKAIVDLQAERDHAEARVREVEAACAAAYRFIEQWGASLVVDPTRKVLEFMRSSRADIGRGWVSPPTAKQALEALRGAREWIAPHGEEYRAAAVLDRRRTNEAIDALEKEVKS